MKMPSRVKVGGRWWKVVEVGYIHHEGKKTWGGLCDYDKKTLFITSSLSPRRKWEVLIHEVLHAAYRDNDEDATVRGEQALVNALDALLP